MYSPCDVGIMKITGPYLIFPPQKSRIIRDAGALLLLPVGVLERTCACEGGRPLRMYTPNRASLPREMLNLRNCGRLRWSRDLQNTPGGTSWVTRLPTSMLPVSILLLRPAHGPGAKGKETA